jgi:hypothetical protein
MVIFDTLFLMDKPLILADMANEINEKLRNECQNALESLEKLKLPETAELQAKLAWCIGSYDYDKNPSGLTEFGEMALKALNRIKEKNPRKVSKKVLEGLEAAISNYEASQY